MAYIQTNAPPQLSQKDADEEIKRVRNGQIGNQALLSYLGADQPVDPNAGRAVTLEAGMKQRLETHFGHSVDNIRFRESSEAEKLGANAFAKGDTVQFAPGMFNQHSTEGQDRIFHEVTHVVQQAEGKVRPSFEGSSLSLADAWEAPAIAAGRAPDAAPAETLSPMPVMSAASAPIQAEGFFERRRRVKAEKKLGKYMQGKEDEYRGAEDPLVQRKWDDMYMEADPRLVQMQAMISPASDHLNQHKAKYGEVMSQDQIRTGDKAGLNIKSLALSSHQIHQYDRQAGYYQARITELSQLKKPTKADKAELKVAQARLKELQDKSASAREGMEKMVGGKEVSGGEDMREWGKNTSRNLLRMYLNPDLPVDTIYDYNTTNGTVPQSVKSLELHSNRPGEKPGYGRASFMGPEWKPTKEYGEASDIIAGRTATSRPGPAVPPRPARMLQQRQLAQGKKGGSRPLPTPPVKRGGSGPLQTPPINPSQSGDKTPSTPVLKPGTDDTPPNVAKPVVSPPPVTADPQPSTGGGEVALDPTNVVHYGIGGNGGSSRTKHIQETKEMLDKRGLKQDDYHTTVDDLNRTVGITPSMMDSPGMLRRELREKVVEKVSKLPPNTPDMSPAVKEGNDWLRWLAEPSRIGALMMPEMDTEQFIKDARLDAGTDDRGGVGSTDSDPVKSEAAYKNSPYKKASKESDELSHEINSGQIDSDTGKAITWTQEGHKADSLRSVDPTFVKWNPEMRSLATSMVNADTSKTVQDFKNKLKEACKRAATSALSFFSSKDKKQKAKAAGIKWGQDIETKFMYWTGRVLPTRFFRLTSIMGIDFFANKGKTVMFTRPAGDQKDFKSPDKKKSRRLITDSEWRHVKKMGYEASGKVKRLDPTDVTKDQKD